MYKHPWCIALLAITLIINDCKESANAIEAWESEDIEVSDLIVIRDALEQICDVSFKEKS